MRERIFGAYGLLYKFILEEIDESLSEQPGRLCFFWFLRKVMREEC